MSPAFWSVFNLMAAYAGIILAIVLAGTFVIRWAMRESRY